MTDFKEFIYHPENEKSLWHEAYYPFGNNDIHMPTEDGLRKHNFGFSGQTIKEAADMVALGCSITFGIGVTEDLLWATQVSKKINLEYHNISGPGRSVSWIINNFFSYVSKFGNPKIVLALFPDFTRMQVTSRPSEMLPESEIYFDENKENLIRYKIYRTKGYESNSKFFKKPLIAEEVLPLEMAFDISIQYIKMLELYCKTNNIKLLWSTWPAEPSDWLDKNIQNTQFTQYISTNLKYWHNYKIDNYVERLCKTNIDFYNSDNFKNLQKTNQHLFARYNITYCDPDTPCEEYVDCHSEFKDVQYFNTASDSNINHGHPAGHKHTHIAEAFLKEINEYDSRN
jgi:hypothetical protein